MPSNLVKTPAQENAWKMAKKQAATEGHADDFDYIVSIFEKMKPKPKQDTPPASTKPKVSR